MVDMCFSFNLSSARVALPPCAADGSAIQENAADGRDPHEGDVRGEEARIRAARGPEPVAHPRAAASEYEDDGGDARSELPVRDQSTAPQSERAGHDQHGARK